MADSRAGAFSGSDSGVASTLGASGGLWNPTGPGSWHWPIANVKLLLTAVGCILGLSPQCGTGQANLFQY